MFQHVMVLTRVKRTKKKRHFTKNKMIKKNTYAMLL